MSWGAKKYCWRPLLVRLHRLAVPSQSRQLLRGIQAFFPAPLTLFSQTGNTKQMMKSKFKCQGEGSVEKPHPTSSLFSHVPVSVQLMYLGLVSFHCLRQSLSMKRQTRVMRGGANRRHIWGKSEREHSPLGSSSRGSSLLLAAEINIQPDFHCLGVNL